MQNGPKLTLAFIALAASASGFAQPAQGPDAAEELKLAALEALITAPSDRALPLVAKVLAGNHSDEVKSRALFILSQIDDPQAQSQLLDVERQGSGEVREEAIRMIGIGGNPEALAQLSELYSSGDAEVRDTVLEAYLIAGDINAVYQIAAAADNEEDFSAAVEMLGAMGANDELRMLRDKVGFSESLIEAYAISGDVESLRALARDASNPEQQEHAIEGLMIAGDDEGLLELYHATDDMEQKRMLLQALSVTGSDMLLDLIDEALTDD